MEFQKNDKLSDLKKFQYFIDGELFLNINKRTNDQRNKNKNMI